METEVCSDFGFIEAALKCLHTVYKFCNRIQCPCAGAGDDFFYKSARAVAACDESEQRQRFRWLKRANPVPEFKEWQLWEGEIHSGYFYTEDLRGVRAQLLAEGHQPKVSMRGLCEWSALRLRVVGGTDCVIRKLCEDAQVLQQWTERLGVPYRGQRLAGASLEVFLHLLQGKREDTRSQREELLVPSARRSKQRALRCFQVGRIFATEAISMFQNCVMLQCSLWLFRSCGKSFSLDPAGTRSKPRPTRLRAGF